ncbi:MAG: HAD hydrolase-like protein [DPANN group archaeon]|nr:HAD hydrolase-like protein [DPANN group archaeon]
MIHHQYLQPSTWFALLRPSLIRPDLALRSINDLDISLLQKKGIKNILFDIDHTLSAYHAPHPSILVKVAFEELKSTFNCVGLTNFNHSSEKGPVMRRKREVEEGFGMACIIPLNKKPSPRAFVGAMKEHHFNPEETAMVGDRIIADIVGGNRAGLFTILVRPLHLGTMPLFYRVVTLIERSIFHLYTLFHIIE